MYKYFKEDPFLFWLLALAVVLAVGDCSAGCDIKIDTTQKNPVEIKYEYQGVP